MINKKWLTILFLVIAFVFLSTSVYAKSGGYYKKYSQSWWYNPIYQIKKAIKDANKLQKNIAKLKRKTNRLENRKNSLEEQISTLEEEIISLQARKAKISIDNQSNNNENEENEKEYFICPGCNFSDSDEFIGYDFSGSFLVHLTASNADMSGANFADAKLRHSYLVISTMQNVNFTGADLFKAVVGGSDFTGACFKDAILDEVAWVDGWYGAATCPDGTTLELVGDTCEGHLELELHCQ
jgi:uncharacterized protein YjbI with pentapeptide repeats